MFRYGSLFLFLLLVYQLLSCFLNNFFQPHLLPLFNLCFILLLDPKHSDSPNVDSTIRAQVIKPSDLWWWSQFEQLPIASLP